MEAQSNGGKGGRKRRVSYGNQKKNDTTGGLDLGNLKGCIRLESNQNRFDAGKKRNIMARGRREERGKVTRTSTGLKANVNAAGRAFYRPKSSTSPSAQKPEAAEGRRNGNKPEPSADIIE